MTYPPHLPNPPRRSTTGTVLKVLGVLFAVVCGLALLLLVVAIAAVRLA